MHGMMYNRCSSSRKAVGSCSCGVFHTPGSSMCVLFSMGSEESDERYSVDCTLSLGTPSTRISEEKKQQVRRSQQRGVPNLCWDMFQPTRQKEQKEEEMGSGARKSGRGSSSSSSSMQLMNNMGRDSLLTRRCANCDTTSTPLWRNGPRGPKSLCNACGIRYKKEERRVGSSMEMNHQQSQGYPWNYSTTGQMHKATSSSPTEFRLIQAHENDTTNPPEVPFLSWRLNVRDRPSFLHDFT